MQRVTELIPTRSWSHPETSRLPVQCWPFLIYFLIILGNGNCCVRTEDLCQPLSRSTTWITQCLLPGMVLSQTTPTPAVINTTLKENVTTLTVTPMILSSTTPGCSLFNTSTCEPCAPGSQYDDSKPVTVSSGVKPLFCSFCYDVELQRHLFLGSLLIPSACVWTSNR